MNDFRNNWDFAESHIDSIKKILKVNAVHIVDIEIASPEDDMKRSTDLKVKITSGDVAVRIRRAYKQYRDLTIRAVNGKAKTEIHKLREGFARWYLYLWTDDNNRICEWILVDIDKMRSSGLLSENRKVTMNKDGYTGFVSYSRNELQNASAIVSRG